MPLLFLLNVRDMPTISPIFMAPFPHSHNYRGSPLFCIGDTNPWTPSWSPIKGVVSPFSFPHSTLHAVSHHVPHIGQFGLKVHPCLPWVKLACIFMHSLPVCARLVARQNLPHKECVCVPCCPGAWCGPWMPIRLLGVCMFNAACISVRLRARACTIGVCCARAHFCRLSSMRYHAHAMALNGARSIANHTIAQELRFQHRATKTRHTFSWNFSLWFKIANYKFYIIKNFVYIYIGFLKTWIYNQTYIWIRLTKLIRNIKG